MNEIQKLFGNKPIPDSENFCVNCKNFKPNWISNDQCVIVQKRDLVTGKPIDIFKKDVEIARYSDCNGKWYVSKYVPSFF